MAMEVLSFGAGVQSTTLLLMSCKGVLPKLDHVIFADTQWEPAAVYRHLEWCKEYAARHGINIAVRTAGNLRENIVRFWGARHDTGVKQHGSSIPAFIKNPDGSRGMVRRQCTTDYKINVIERYVREEVLGLRKGQWWPKELVVRQWIGISTDEVQRMKKSLRPAVSMWHPLIEADELARIIPGRIFPVGYSRSDCLAWISAEGFPQPPRSACIGCPFHRNDEWRRLTPEEFADACEVDRLIRHGDSVRIDAIGSGDLIGQPYLHSTLVPLSEADIGVDSGLGMEHECEGVCGV